MIQIFNSGDFGISKVLDSEKSFTKTMSMTPYNIIYHFLNYNFDLFYFFIKIFLNIL